MSSYADTDFPFLKEKNSQTPKNCSKPQNKECPPLNSCYLLFMQSDKKGTVCVSVDSHGRAFSLKQKTQ